MLMMLNKNVIIYKLSKILIWPICRVYSKYLNDRPADVVYKFLCSIQYLLTYESWPNLNNPIMFSEKLWNRMLFNRDPILTLISDKFKVRNLVEEKIGKEYLIPIIWSGEKPEDIPYTDLPERFVIKTNHGCGFNIIVNNKVILNKEYIKKKIKKWLSTNFATSKFIGSEWGYKNISPVIMIEKFIGEGEKVPIDYKFYIFNGQIELVTVHFDRFEDNKVLAFNRHYELLSFQNENKMYKGAHIKPKKYTEMVNIAEAVSSGFDFMRVDLYYVDDKIYFGELTPYPGGIAKVQGFDVDKYNFELGLKWNII